MDMGRNSKEAYLHNERPWYEGPDGSCHLIEPTLIKMGDDQPCNLMFPVHWSEAMCVLPEAKKRAHELNAFLVLMLYGEASDSEIQSIVLELADAQVLPLWIGEHNRKKFDKIVEMLSQKG